MARPNSLTDAKKARIDLLRRKKWTLKAIAEDRYVDVHFSTVSRYLAGQYGEGDRPKGMPAKVQQYGPAAQEAWDEENPSPKAYRELVPEAQFALQFFFFFCDFVLGEPLLPHQEEWFRLEAEQAFTQINAHPRSGKTDLHNKKAVWRLAGGGRPPEWYCQEDPPLRDIRRMLVSGAENQSDKNFSYIEVRLSGHGRLINLYGRFKRSGLVWRPSMRVLTVDGRRQLMLSGDYSLVCVGTGSHVLGRGADDIDCDDPFDMENCSTPELVEKRLRWLRVHVFSRWEPPAANGIPIGGGIAILGARLPLPNEPYTQIAAWPGDLAEHWDADEEVEPDDDAPATTLFRTVVQPAVLDWTARTILAVGRFTWRTLMAARRLAGEETWEASWMQNPSGNRSSLARSEWIYGGVLDGIAYPGCLDPDRLAGESPPRVAATSTGREPTPSIRVMLTDPSVVKWWGSLMVDLFKDGDPEYHPVILDLDRAKHSTSSYLALLDRWWKAYHFRVLVLERNIAKFLLENEAFLGFCRRSGVRVIPHYTDETNRNGRWGVGTLSHDFEACRIRIPSGDTDTRWNMQYLIKEALGEISTDDLLMALWFGKFNLAGLLAMVESDGGWQGWDGAPRGRSAMPARMQKAFAR